jgi:putative tryptophan/tyrosine transport system substrate-binding protein
VDRRNFSLLLAGTTGALSFPALAQPSKPRLLGAFTMGPPLNSAAGRGAVLIGGLRQRGFTLGQNLAYEARGTAGKMDQIPNLIEELKALGVEAIVTIGYPTAAAAKATGIPTVLASGAGDPVATGLIQSLSRPGGSVTGISDDAALLSTKRLSLLKEMVPQLRRVAMLYNRDDAAMSLRFEASAKAAREIGATVQPLGVREPNDFDHAFAAMSGEPPDAILMVSDSLTLLNRKRVIGFAAERRIPAIYEADSIARDGGLMSYGADDRETFDRVAALVARIFNGAKPADLPVEQPTKYQFIVNLKTARAMNIEVPATLLAFADDLIE